MLFFLYVWFIFGFFFFFQAEDGIRDVAVTGVQTCALPIFVRGHIRLNVGKYGSMAKSDQTIDTVNTALDVSAVEYEREPRYRSGGYSGERRSGSGGGDRQFEFGTFGGGRSGGSGSGSGGGGRDRDRDRRDRGRRRF